MGRFAFTARVGARLFSASNEHLVALGFFPWVVCGVCCSGALLSFLLRAGFSAGDALRCVALVVSIRIMWGKRGIALAGATLWVVGCGTGGLAARGAEILIDASTVRAVDARIEAQDGSTDGRTADASLRDGATDSAFVDSAGHDVSLGHDDAGVERACRVSPVDDPLAVAVDTGLVRGRASGEGVAFLGIPYASPPTGARRFAAPEPAACWDGVRDAYEVGSVCPQKDMSLGLFVGDEDCLYANVWTPGVPGTDATTKPVLVFVHGGGNVVGSGDMNPLAGPTEAFGLDVSAIGLGSSSGLNLYDGQHLSADEDVVVVTFNYRLGPLGFLAHPALGAENPDGASGNYALLDQLALLEWVQRNIGAFGGDPDRVMLFGHSAGAANTCVLLASPLARGLFQAALMESGSCAVRSLAAQSDVGEQVARLVGCGRAAGAAECLRTVSAETLIGTNADLFSVDFVEGLNALMRGELGYPPTIDGVVLPDHPMSIIRAGDHNRVPFTIGSNADEMELFLGPPTTLATCFQYEGRVDAWFGANADAVLEQYPCWFLDGRNTAMQMLTDLLFTCPARRIARAVEAAQSEPVYRYRFEHVLDVSPFSFLGAFHGAEAMFVFKTVGLVGVETRAEASLSEQIGGYWTRLANRGDPNELGALHWDPYRSGDDNVLVLSTPSSTREGVSTERCDFWDTLASE